VTELLNRSPKVSVVTVCFNSAKTIRSTIESVLSQTYSPLEYIVIDGGSTDETMQIVNEYASKIGVVVSEPDKGIYDAMNKGIAIATGDIIGMLNSDDTYADVNVVHDLVNAMLRAEVDSVYADVVYVDPSNPSTVVRYYNSGRWRPSRFRYGWMPAHPSFLVKREWYLKCGLYSLRYRIAADFEMLVRLLWRARVSSTYVPRAVVEMKTGGISTRGLKNSWLLNNEIVRACRSNGMWTCLPLLILKFPFKLLELIPTLKRTRLGGR
jgi:glycosyltransferase involved in cell wall biosynthesis